MGVFSRYIIKKINKISGTNFLYYCFVLFLIVYGIVFRFDVLYHSGGLFHSEVDLFENIRTKNYCELFLPLSFLQCAPPLFLCCSKFLYSILGFNEVVLRFLPCVFSVFTLILIPFLSKYIFINKFLSLMFLIFLIFSPTHSENACLFKQYSSDVFFCVGLYYLFFLLKIERRNPLHVFLFGILFGLIGYFSFTAEFILFPMILYYIYIFIRENQYKKIYFLIAPYIILLSIEYIFLLGSYNGGNIGESWKEYNPQIYLYDEIRRYFYLFVTNRISAEILLMGSLIGFVFLVKKKIIVCYILTTPIIFNCLTGILGLYPFPPAYHSRLLLYLSPVLIIFVLSFFDYAFSKIKDCFIRKISILLFSIFVFFFHKSTSSFVQFSSLSSTDEVFQNVRKIVKTKEDYLYFYRTDAREFVRKLNEKKVLEDDVIILHRQNCNIFPFYAEKVIAKDKLSAMYKLKCVFTNSDISNLDQIAQFNGVWFHSSSYYSKDEEVAMWIIEWIEKNTKVVVREEDEYGTLIYGMKVK